MKNTILVVAVVFLTASLASAEVLYILIDLGTLGGSGSQAYAVNNLGKVVGNAENDLGYFKAVLFDADNPSNNVDLTPNSQYARAARSINDSGQIVGAGQGFQAVLFDPSGNGNNIYLGNFGGFFSGAHSINNHGKIVGYGTISRDFPNSAALFDPTGDGNNVNLGAEVQCSGAESVNDDGQIVGYAGDFDDGIHATLFDSSGKGNNIDLGTLGGFDSSASSINNNGLIVGRSDTASGVIHATLFDITGDGNNIDLGTLSGGSKSFALSINDYGDIVGMSQTSAGNWHATLFDPTGNSNNIDLNTLIEPSLDWTLRVAQCINENGWIVGSGYNPGGYVRAFLLIPIPEPIPPVADADGPYVIYVGDVLTLDASGSTDANDDIVSYMWDLDDNGSFETDAGGLAIFDVNYAYLQSLGLLINYTYTIHLKVTDSEGQSDVNDSTLIIVPKPATVVAVDIKPGSCPNPVNVKSSGVLPVAILGTEDVNVLDIDPASIQLAGVEPLRSSYEDVATPVSDSNDCNCTTDGPDGFLDLTLKFKTQRIVEAVGDVNDGDVLTLELTGVLFDPMPFETPIEGADCILIRGRHKPINPADINKDGVVNAADFAIFAQNWLQSSIVED